LQVGEILDAVRSGEGDGGMMQWRLPEEPAVEAMLRARDTAVAQAMHQQTLKGMVLSAANSPVGMDTSDAGGKAA